MPAPPKKGGYGSLVTNLLAIHQVW